MQELTLFDTIQSAPKPRAVNPNSVESFYNKETQLKRGTQKWLIYECLRVSGALSQREISELTKIPRYLVPDRIIQLTAFGHVEIAGEKIDETTGKRVNTYKIK